MPPKLTHSENGLEDEDTSLLLEAQYRIPISDHIMITPGFFVVFNPDRDSDNKVKVICTNNPHGNNSDTAT